MKNIIITCGTSILNSKIITTDLKEKIDEIETGEKNDDFISYFTKDNFKVLKSTIKITSYGAEINLLQKVYNKGDNIFLFFSETHGGKIVKEILKGYFKTKYAEKVYKDNNFEIEDNNFIEIKGFKVDNTITFQKEAIPNFFKELEKIKNKFNIECNLTSFNDITKKTKIETIMCPVGGYKALIPYSSLYAMVNGWDIKYLYEDRDELMSLPSGALTNLSGDLILSNKINIDIFKNTNNLSNSYNYQDGLRLSIGIKNFIEYGKSKELSNICNNFKNIFIKNKNYGSEKACFEQLGKHLINLSNAFDLIRLNDIKSSIKSIIDLDINIISDLLINNSIKYLQEQLKEIDIANLVKWYYEKQRYAECILIMREGIINFIGDKLNIKHKERDDRVKIDNTLQLFKFNTKEKDRQYLLKDQEIKIKYIFKGNETFFEELTNKRNNFAHINENESLETMKKGIKKLYNTYSSIVNM